MLTLEGYSPLGAGGNFCITARVDSPGFYSVGDCMGMTTVPLDWANDACWKRYSYRSPGDSGSGSMPLKEECKAKYGTEIQKTIDNVDKHFQNMLDAYKTPGPAPVPTTTSPPLNTPSFWATYKWWIIGGAAATATIATVLVRRKRSLPQT